MTEKRTNVRRVVLSTCGTSLLNNGADGAMRQLLRNTANLVEPDAASLQHLQTLVDDRRHHLEKATVEQAMSASAELNGIARLYDQDIRQGATDVHMVLHTDTWQGRQTSGLVKDWLEANGLTVYSVPEFPHLRADDVVEFKAALPAVVKWCEDTFPGYSQSGYEIVFNLTGGFKSINGFVQVLGMFYADEIVYVFESGTDLLRIPRLPLKHDFTHVVEGHFDLFRALAHGRRVPASDCKAIPEALLTVVDTDVDLSEWGELVWERGRGRRYEAGLLEPFSPLIASQRFRSEASALVPKEPTRMRQLNDRLEELAVAVKGGLNPKALRFHPLTGNPCPPSTHECYIWTGDASRIYGHYESGSYILDTLGGHL